MKEAISLAILSGCLLWACTNIQPPPTPEPTKPPVVSARLYRITQYNPDGSAASQWMTGSYHETDFPRSVSFTTDKGKTITIEGSYQINEVLK